MRALHVFPLFGSDLTNGSEHYQYMLTRALVRRGVTVDVLATTSRAIRATSAFGLQWDPAYPAGVERSDGMSIHRFPVSFSVPATLGHAVSRTILRRWAREDRRYGRMLKGSRHLIEHFWARAVDRPAAYDALALLARGPHSARLLLQTARLIRCADVALVGFLPFALVSQVTAIARAVRKPVVILPLFHPDDLYHHFRPYYRALARADAVLAQTPYSADLIKRLVPGANPVPVGAGVDAGAFGDSAVSGAGFRAKHGLLGMRIVLFVGRKEPSKRYDMVVDAVDLIDDPRVTLVMIGADVDRRPLTSARVRYLGTVDRQELVDAYDASDVFVLPSEHESFGMVFLEAWMRKKPVIGNRRCGAVASLIRDGETGYLCSDPAEIATRIVTLLGDPSLARTLGEAGHRMATTAYTWEAVACRVHAVYTGVAKLTPPGVANLTPSGTPRGAA